MGSEHGQTDRSCIPIRHRRWCPSLSFLMIRFAEVLSWSVCGHVAPFEDRADAKPEPRLLFPGSLGTSSTSPHVTRSAARPTAAATSKWRPVVAHGFFLQRSRNLDFSKYYEAKSWSNCRILWHHRNVILFLYFNIFFCREAFKQVVRSARVFCLFCGRNSLHDEWIPRKIARENLYRANREATSAISVFESNLTWNSRVRAMNFFLNRISQRKDIEDALLRFSARETPLQR